MSPNNPIANWDQISVWYIPSVPGTNTEMYFVITHFVFVTLFAPNVGAQEIIVDSGDY